MARVYGYVRDSKTNEPIAGAKVTLVPKQHAAPSPSVTTDSQGFYEFLDGTFWYALVHTLKASKSGYLPFSASFVTPKPLKEKRQDIFLEKVPETEYAWYYLYVQDTDILYTEVTARFYKDGEMQVRRDRIEGGSLQQLVYEGDPGSEIFIRTDSRYYKRRKVQDTFPSQQGGYKTKTVELFKYSSAQKEEFGVLRGSVTNEKGEPVPNREVEVDGELTYTAGDGVFYVSGLRDGERYTVTVRPGKLYQGRTKKVRIEGGKTNEVSLKVYMRLYIDKIVRDFYLRDGTVREYFYIRDHIRGITFSIRGDKLEELGISGLDIGDAVALDISETDNGGKRYDLVGSDGRKWKYQAPEDPGDRVYVRGDPEKIGSLLGFVPSSSIWIKKQD